MPTSSDEGVAEAVSSDDPRVNGEFLRSIPAGDDAEPGVVVGVVHDHPASVYRVRAVTERVDPDVVALELPGIALPPVERTAREHDDGSPLEDEMSAAVAASDDARVVGIDAPSRPFVRHFLDGARREGASVGTLRRAVAATVGVTRNAVSWRIGAHRRTRSAGPWAGRGSRFEYDVTAGDPPDLQASDERAAAARSRSLLGAIERPLAQRLIDDARERTMASMLDDLRREGTVVAVVGIDHLDAVTDQLLEPSGAD